MLYVCLLNIYSTLYKSSLSYNYLHVIINKISQQIDHISCIKAGLHASSGPPAAPLPLLGPFVPAVSSFLNPPRSHCAQSTSRCLTHSPWQVWGVQVNGLKFSRIIIPVPGSQWPRFTAESHVWPLEAVDCGGKANFHHHRELWPVLVHTAHLRLSHHRPVSLGSQGLPRPPRASGQASFQKHVLHTGVLHTPLVSHLSRPGSSPFF